MPRAKKVHHPAEYPTSRCYLLTIPPEIRDAILKYILVLPEPLEYHILENDGQTHVPDVDPSLDIACACKQLLWEAIPIYYSGNSFWFGDINSCT